MKVEDDITGTSVCVYRAIRQPAYLSAAEVWQVQCVW
ncbi:hypothetical protein PC128_g14095 [Phytophthora cactorum]|nr:hypothetical protein PC128_g14095 [Phytophthora cactorum]